MKKRSKDRLEVIEKEQDRPTIFSSQLLKYYLKSMKKLMKKKKMKNWRKTRAKRNRILINK